MQSRRAFVSLALCVACSDPVHPPLQATIDAAQAEVGAMPVIASAVDIGTIVQNAVIYGRDGNFSTRIGNRSVWTFGDTPMSVPGIEQNNWVDNSMSWTTDLDASDGITLTNDILDPTGAPGEFLPYTTFESQYNYAHDKRHCTAQPCGAEYALWPGAIIADPERGRALVFYYLLWRIPGQSGWTGIGTGLAAGAPDGTFTRPILNPGNADPTLMWDSTEVAYGSGAMVMKDTLYSYGCTPQFLRQHCRVARVPLAQALVKSAWRYYAGHGAWSANPATAIVSFDGGAAGNTVFYDAYVNRFVLVYSGVFSDDVFFRVAPNPWGPWSNQTKMFTARPGWNGNISYAAEAHPEYNEKGGKIFYVTYAHATGFLRSDFPIVKVTFR